VIAAGHGWGLAIFPLGAALIATVFGAILVVRFVRRRRPHEGVWAIALAMYAAASLAMFLGVVGGWDPPEYRIYWLLGAVLNVPFLAQGEVYILARRRRVAHLVGGTLVAASLISAWITWSGSLRASALAGVLPLGKDAWSGSSPYQLRYLAWLGYLALLGGLVWSVYGMRGKPELRDRTAGTVGIGIGATAVAIGSGVGAGYHLVPLFSVSLAVGIAVMFWGFRRASGRPRAAAGRS
jgi:hypothetical protein